MGFEKKIWPKTSASMIFPKHCTVMQNDDVFEQYFSLIAALKLSDIAGVKNIASL